MFQNFPQSEILKLPKFPLKYMFKNAWNLKIIERHNLEKLLDHS